MLSRTLLPWIVISGMCIFGCTTTNAVEKTQEKTQEKQQENNVGNPTEQDPKNPDSAKNNAAKNAEKNDAGAATSKSDGGEQVDAADSGTPAKPVDLYTRLGQEAGLRRLVTSIHNRVYADKRIYYMFVLTDRGHLENSVYLWLCRASGGECKYSLEHMHRQHTPLDITKIGFDAYMEDVTQALDDEKIVDPEKEEVLALFRSVYGAVVANPEVQGEPAPSETP